MQKAADKEEMKVVEHPGSLREALEWLKAAADQRIANVHECLGFNPARSSPVPDRFSAHTIG